MIEDIVGKLLLIFISFLMLLAMIGLTYYAVASIYEHYKLNIKTLRENLKGRANND